tara:strand:+ start:1561 stop:1809 length:249 start_codon:yes stop_codon:yes gene_type:complete
VLGQIEKWHALCIYISNSFNPGERKMKKLLLLLLVLGSLSVFAANGEDRVSVTEGVICQAEEGKPTTNAVQGEEADGSVVPQ